VKLDTLLLHAGRESYAGAVCTPVFQSATFTGDPDQQPIYTRLNNTPNHALLHARLAAIAGAEAALVSASGMASVSTTLLSVLGAGDHLLALDCLYGGTNGFLRRLAPDLGIEHDFIGGNAPETWAALLRPRTRAVYVETMTNPMLEVPDLEAIVAFAREHGLVSIIDNTFASPVNFQPLALGFDLEVHSATKYLNGHSDICAGVVLGSAAHIKKIASRMDILGGCLDPHACFLLERGLKTLSLRVERHNANGAALAELLADHPAVASVRYPGLPDHPQHDRARRLFAGCGGVLAFEPRVDARALLDRLTLAANAPSLGGVETLVTRPVTSSHRGVSAADRARIGLTDQLVRVSVGIEAFEDLRDDFDRALTTA
jgi:cystathionine beta-lyase/cystathionine gamma-synthase